MVQKAYLKIRAGDSVLEFDLILYKEQVPKTVANFVHYLKERGSIPRNQQQAGYLHSSFHRIIKGFMAQGGDFVNGNGTGSTSIYGGTFADENFIHRHDRPGMLSMANSGRNTNGSQFFITFRPTPHLDNKHVVFGHVDLSTNVSRNNLKILENVRTGRNDKPTHDVQIMDCGVIEEKQKQEPKEENTTTRNETTKDEKTPVEEPAKDENELELEEEEEEEEEPPKTKAEALRQRMRKLKMKMNQARQLNKQEVLKEGERLGSAEGAAKARRRQQHLDRKVKETEWKERNTKALEIAKAAGLDGKHLVEQADASLKKAYKQQVKQETNQFAINDYYNPQGMHRNYQRNLKSLTHAAGTASATSTETFDPILNESDEQRERQGARNLANEMKRRIEKQKQKRSRIEFEQEDVSWINQRNKKFNQQISRNYDKHTAEIRQNLERGTAL